MGVAEHPAHSYDEVELHATRHGDSVVLYLGRATANEERDPVRVRTAASG